MLLPYKVLAVLLLCMSLFAGGFGYGVKVTRDRDNAQNLAAQRLADDKYRAEVARGNDLSAQLAAAESNIQIKTVERIKYVPQVTTGRDCLNPDAVGLLNNSTYPKLSESTGKPVAENAGSSATDADVVTWGIYAQGEYETCAARLDKLIDLFKPAQSVP